MTPTTAKARLWLFDITMKFDRWLHKIGMPGHWWCDATDWLMWRIVEFRASPSKEIR